MLPPGLPESRFPLRKPRFAGATNQFAKRLEALLFFLRSKTLPGRFAFQIPPLQLAERTNRLPERLRRKTRRPRIFLAQFLFRSEVARFLRRELTFRAGREPLRVNLPAIVPAS